jgi:hypothetical protein
MSRACRTGQRYRQSTGEALDCDRCPYEDTAKCDEKEETREDRDDQD